MKGLFSRLVFTGFGPNSLTSSLECPPYCAIQGRRPTRLRALVRADCPRLPGVYGMVDGNGELIYVGKAKCLRSRRGPHFQSIGADNDGLAHGCLANCPLSVVRGQL